MWDFPLAKSLTGSKSVPGLLRPGRPGTKRSARARTRITSLAAARNAVQVLVSLVLLYAGLQFYLFVTHFETGGRTPFVARPPLVEGFLPISGLVSVKLDMDGAAIAAFVHSPYNMIVDVKMLYFFTKMSTGVMVFLLALLAISAVVKNFWCRYLCPYGALLGLISFLSPVTVTRNASLCTGCGACTRVCPNRIDVARATSVASPECSACLTCVNACPKRGALQLRVLGERAISGWAFAALLIAFPTVMLILARVTGHWETSLTYADWAQLIPLAEAVAHP